MKKCTRCKQNKSSNEFYKRRETKCGLKSWCINCEREYRQSPTEKQRRIIKSAQYRALVTTQTRIQKYKLDIKMKVLNHYGPCACCGEKDHRFLSIDHINNDGAEQKRATIGSRNNSVSFYIWIIKNHFPKDLQTLCYNCNCAKQFNGLGICPHKLSI